MSSTNPQPGLDFLVELSNRECCHAINAIIASKESKESKALYFLGNEAMVQALALVMMGPNAR